MDLTPVPFSMEITLDAGAPRAAWRITVDNRVKDHRLRVTFPAGTASVSSVTSDTAFGVIARPAHREAQEVPGVEVAVDSFPFQSFAANGVDGGAAVYAEGLHEYEVLAEDPPTLAITLLRCVGDLSREDLATRKHGHAGPGLVTPGAQCPGLHAFALSFEPLPTAPGPMQLYAGSAALLAPPRMALADASLNGERRIPETASMVSVDAEVTGLVLSACRKTEGRESLTLRVFNPSAVATTATMGAHLHAGEVFVLNLDSARQQALKVAHGAAVLDVGPFAIQTVELVPARTAP